MTTPEIIEAITYKSGSVAGRINELSLAYFLEEQNKRIKALEGKVQDGVQDTVQVAQKIEVRDLDMFSDRPLVYQEKDDLESRFETTKFAKGGGLSFECSDFEGMYTDLLDFIRAEVKAEGDRRYKEGQEAQEKLCALHCEQQRRAGRKEALEEVLELIERKYDPNYTARELVRSIKKLKDL